MADMVMFFYHKMISHGREVLWQQQGSALLWCSEQVFNWRMWCFAGAESTGGIEARINALAVLLIQVTGVQNIGFEYLQSNLLGAAAQGTDGKNLMVHGIIAHIQLKKHCLNFKCFNSYAWKSL